MNFRKSKWQRPSYTKECGPYGAWNDRVDKLIQHCLTHSNDLHSQKIFRLLYIAYIEVEEKYKKAVKDRELQRQRQIAKSLSGAPYKEWGFVGAFKDLGIELPEIIGHSRYVTHCQVNKVLDTKPKDEEHYKEVMGRRQPWWAEFDPGFIRHSLSSTDYIRCNVSFYAKEKICNRDVFYLLKSDTPDMLKPSLTDLVNHCKEYSYPSYTDERYKGKSVSVSGYWYLSDEEEWNVARSESPYPWTDRIQVNFYDE